MSKKYVDCIYCKGRGFNYTNAMSKSMCKECEGTGSKEIKDTRKSVLMDRDLKEDFEDLQVKRGFTTLIAYFRSLRDEENGRQYGIKKDE